MKGNKDIVGKIVQYFRDRGESQFLAAKKVVEFDCTRAGLSHCLNSLVSTDILLVVSGKYGPGYNNAVFKLADEYMTGDDWRAVLKNTQRATTRQLKTEQLNSDNALAVLDQQIEDERAQMRVLQERRRYIENLLTQKQRIEDEITELKRQTGLKLNQLRQIEKQIREPSLSEKLAKLSAKNDGKSNQDSSESAQDTPETVPVTTFDAEIAHFDRVSRETVRTVPVTREGYVGVVTDLSR